MPSSSRAASLPGSSARSAMQTRASSSAKRRAVSRPMPLAPPVMTATLPVRRPGLSVLLRGQIDVLYLGVVVEGVRAELTSDAGLLEAPEGRADPYGGVGVYRDHTRLHAPRHAQGTGAVLGPDRTGEAVDGVVGLTDGVFFVLEGDHRDHGAEDLLPGRLVVVGDGGQYGGRVPEPGTLGRLAAERHGRVFGDVGGDLLAVVGGDQGTHLRLLVERVPDAQPRDGRLHEREKLVEDTLLYLYTRAGTAVLLGVAEDGDGRRRGGLLQVGVGEDHVRGLATQFEGDALYSACGAGHDALADLRGTREGDLRDVRMLDETFPHLSPRPADDLDDALGDARLERYAPELHGGERRELGRLEDERVARREGRGHLPARDGEREVPRDDEPDDAQRLTERNVDAPRDRDGVAEQFLGHPRVVVKGLRHHLHLGARVADRLACVLRLQLREVLVLCLQGVGEAPEEARTVAGLYVPPRREGFPGAGDGRVGVAFGGWFDPLYHLFGGRVQDFEHLGDLRN